ncbi:MAG: LLM class flavin-dependent oxidoreductase [Chloroflexota bacterium]|nr:LLM class flavin-dependent oxidoreductase [Chloroflexota bacterium]
MAHVNFGLMLQSQANNLPASQLMEHNRRLIGTLPPNFTTIWLEDHLQWEETAVVECMTTLTYLAAEFPNLNVGTLVLSQGYRNPALLAKMAANLQFLTGGRFILGIGAGWKEDEYRAFGYPFPDARTRVEELEEAVQIIRAMWTKVPATFTGKHYSIDNAYCVPQPSPMIPLVIGGGGEQRTLAVVAKYADWYNFNSCTVDQYAYKVEVLREHCERVGRDFSKIKLTYLGTVSVSEDPKQVVRSPEKHVVAGNSAEVIRELEQFAEVGVSHFMFRFMDVDVLRRFCETVVPHFG